MAGVWGERVLSALVAAVDRARSGCPTVVWVVGEPGMGKSTLLTEVTGRAADFHVLGTEALDGDTAPFSSLAGWGLGLDRSLGGEVMSPFAAAQRIRVAVDAAAGTAGRPVLLRLDDVQWADPESVDAVMGLLQRAEGDRLLLVAASRPLGEGQPGWRRWIARRPDAVTVDLAGLTLAEAAELVGRAHPGADEVMVRQLWEHTSGNPLYLSALLDEQDVAGLSRSRVMPAPAAFAEATGRRLAGLDESAVGLMRAAVVLGSGWVSLFGAAEVGQVDDADDAAQALLEAGLLQLRELDGVLVRPAHALVRSAIYQQIPLPTRRILHAAAAKVVDDQATALEHLVAAAGRSDPVLAGELADYAQELYGRRSYRVAARFLRWSSGLTGDRVLRQRRWLDAVFCSVLAHDFQVVRAELPAVNRVDDPLRRALVIGALDVVEGQWVRAVQTLSYPQTSEEPGGGTGGGAGQDDDQDGRRIRYRIEVLLAYARFVIGGDTGAVLDGLARAAALGVTDAGVTPFADFTQGLAWTRAAGPEQVLAGLTNLPANPALATDEQMAQLGFRGLILLAMGFFERGVADLRVAQTRIQAGTSDDVSAGGVHGFLGCGYWLLGEWDLARLSFRLSSEIMPGFAHPAVVMLPLDPVGRGDFAEADRLLQRSDRMLSDTPSQEAIQVHFITMVARLHAGGTDAERAALLPGSRGRWPGPMTGQGLPGVLWLLHAALAAIWAHEPDQATKWVQEMKGRSPRPQWTEAAATWVTGLLAERRGEQHAAVKLLRRAAELDARSMPLYRAHILTDHARLEHTTGDQDRAVAARAAALELYRGLGAKSYVARLESQPGPTTVSPIPAQTRGFDHRLTDRERDVLTLVSAGLSHAQIAADLFVTRSTVGYHLTNIYAKVGVTSRHQLAAAIRHNPHALGMSTAAS